MILSNQNENINNVLNYDGDSINDFITLIYKCDFLSNLIQDQETYSDLFKNLRWQQIHGDPEFDRSEIKEMISFISDNI